jgi:hypothetical protein
MQILMLAISRQDASKLTYKSVLLFINKVCGTRYLILFTLLCVIKLPHANIHTSHTILIIYYHYQNTQKIVFIVIIIQMIWNNNNIIIIIIIMLKRQPIHKVNLIAHIRVTSHMRLRAYVHSTSSTLIDGKGGVGPSLLHTTLEGLMEYVNARWM